MPQLQYVFTPLLVLIVSIFSIASLMAQESSKNKLIDKEFSVDELKEDFTVLRNKYEGTLANLYLYASKERLDHVFDSLYRNIVPMTAERFYSYITPLSSMIRDGHSNIYPPKEVTEYHDAHSSFFPFNIYWDGGRMVVGNNFSEDTTIRAGNEILTINGLPAFAVMHYLLKRQVRDGNNENYALWILNHYFREYYSYHFDHPPQYQLEIRNAENKFKSISVKALPKETIRINQVKRMSHTSGNSKSYFRIDSTSGAGIFAIRTWDDSHLDQEIDDVFSKLKSKGIDQLIIDVRDNQGGNFEPAIYLLSYLLPGPFQYFTELKSVKSKTESGQQLTDETGKMLGMHDVKSNPYKGKLYILINGGSFSNTAAFCSRIEYYKRGVFIGEETGGNKVVFSGEFGLKPNTILPNTNIVCENGNYRLTVTDLNENKGHGVMPTYPIRQTIDDLIYGTDTPMNKAFQIIMQKE